MAKSEQKTPVGISTGLAALSGVMALTAGMLLGSDTTIAQTTDNVNDVFDDSPQLIDPDRGVNIGELVNLSRQLNGPSEARGARTTVLDDEVLRYRESQERSFGPNIFDDDEVEASTDAEVVEDPALEGDSDEAIAP